MCEALEALELEHLSLPNLTILRPTSILSSSATGTLLETVDHSLAVGKTAILINLQNILFIDSIGLASLVIAFKRVRSVQGRFALCHLNSQAQLLMEQSGMEQVFEVYATEAEFTSKIASTTD